MTLSAIHKNKEMLDVLLYLNVICNDFTCKNKYLVLPNILKLLSFLYDHMIQRSEENYMFDCFLNYMFDC